MAGSKIDGFRLGIYVFEDAEVVDFAAPYGVFSVARRYDPALDVFLAAGALPAKTKQLIAVAVAHVTQCPYCISGHAKLARRAGASDQEIMEAIWVAAEMRAGGAFAHSTVALHALDDERQRPPLGSPADAGARAARPGRSRATPGLPLRTRQAMMARLARRGR